MDQYSYDKDIFVLVMASRSIVAACNQCLNNEMVAYITNLEGEVGRLRALLEECNERQEFY